MPVTIPGLETLPANARINGGPTAPAFFDFFFSDNLGRPADNFSQFIQWTVADGSVDFVGGFGPGVFGAPPNDPAGRYVDLGGSTGNPGRFQTLLAYPIVAGQTFNLTFDYRSTAGDRNVATVTVGDQSWTVATSSTNFQRFSRDFTATTTSLVQITFQGRESDTDGSGIGINGVLFGMVANPDTQDDVLVASPNPNFLDGGAGNDTLIGGMFADRLNGGTGDDTVNGMAGDDILTGGLGDDTIDGGLGVDTVTYATARAAMTVRLASSIARGEGTDRLAGIENVTGSRFNDYIAGDAGDNVLRGEAGDDRLVGGAGADRLVGGAGSDTLLGQDGADRISAGSGDDTLVGGAGADVLDGGAGADIFLFDDLADSVTGARDTIVDFSHAEEDRIDLARMDADITTSGAQAFAFIGDAAFTGKAGELGVVYGNGYAVLRGDVDGDGLADFALRVDGVTTSSPLTSIDLIL